MLSAVSCSYYEEGLVDMIDGILCQGSQFFHLVSFNLIKYNFNHCFNFHYATSNFGPTLLLTLIISSGFKMIWKVYKDALIGQ